MEMGDNNLFGEPVDSAEGTLVSKAKKLGNSDVTKDNVVMIALPSHTPTSILGSDTITLAEGTAKKLEAFEPTSASSTIQFLADVTTLWRYSTESNEIDMLHALSIKGLKEPSLLRIRKWFFNLLDSALSETIETLRTQLPTIETVIVYAQEISILEREQTESIHELIYQALWINWS